MLHDAAPAAAALRVLRPADAHLHEPALPAAGQDREEQDPRRHHQPRLYLEECTVNNAIVGLRSRIDKAAVIQVGMCDVRLNGAELYIQYPLSTATSFCPAAHSTASGAVSWLRNRHTQAHQGKRHRSRHHCEGICSSKLPWRGRTR